MSSIIQSISAKKLENGATCATDKDCKSKQCSSCPVGPDRSGQPVDDGKRCGKKIKEACTRAGDCCSGKCTNGKCTMKPLQAPVPPKSRGNHFLTIHLVYVSCSK